MPQMTGDDKAAFLTVVRWLHRFQRTFEPEDEGWKRVEKCLKLLGRVLTRFEARVRRGTVIRRVDLRDVRERERRRSGRRNVDWEREPWWVPRDFRHLYR